MKLAFNAPSPPWRHTNLLLCALSDSWQKRRAHEKEKTTRERRMICATENSDNDKV
jgi:hypothetical protein